MAEQLPDIHTMMESVLEMWVNDLIGFVGQLRQAGIVSKTITQRITADYAKNLGGLQSKLEERFKVLQRSHYRQGIRSTIADGDDPDDMRFMWNSNGVNTCTTCRSRHGQIRTWANWERLGLPGAGTTECRINCRCTLLPVEKAQRIYGVADERDLTEAAREPIVVHEQLVAAEEKARGGVFADSTRTRRLGQFRQPDAPINQTANTSVADQEAVRVMKIARDLLKADGVDILTAPVSTIKRTMAKVREGLNVGAYD